MAKVVKNTVYELLKKRVEEKSEPAQALIEAIVIKPLGAYETIISTVQHGLDTDPDIIAFLQGEMMAEQMEKMMSEGKTVEECEGMAAKTEEVGVPMVNPMGMRMYANLIATFPTFCIFEFGDDTYRVNYTYNSQTRDVEFDEPVEVIIDASIATASE